MIEAFHHHLFDSVRHVFRALRVKCRRLLTFGARQAGAAFMMPAVVIPARVTARSPDAARGSRYRETEYGLHE